MRKIEPYKPVKTQEPIQLSKIPDGHTCDDGNLAPIERDDWPAPPAAAAAYPDLCTSHFLAFSFAIGFDGSICKASGELYRNFLAFLDLDVAFYCLVFLSID